MSVYSYNVIITLCHKIRKIQEKNCKVSDYSSIYLFIYFFFFLRINLCDFIKVNQLHPTIKQKQCVMRLVCV